MSNSDGQVRIIIDTNANEAVKELDNVSNAFKKSGKSAQDASTLYGEYSQVISENIEIMREMALGNMENSKRFQELARQTKDYQEQLNRANSAVQKATGGLRNQQSGMSSLMGAVKKLGLAYVAIQAAKKALDFSLESVEAYRTQERAVTGLNTALQNAGVYTSEYSAHLQNLASEIQSYSNYGDEAILKAQGVAQAFMGSVPITDALTKAVVDFAAAMDMDLEQAFTLVGKSIGSSTNALGRYGVELGKGMTDSQKMEAITKQLGDRYEGQAAQMVNSSIQLKNVWGDLKETIGQSLNPAFEVLNRSTIDIIKNFQTWINKTRILRADLQSLTMDELRVRAQENIKKIGQNYDMLSKNGLINRKAINEDIKTLENANKQIYNQMKTLRTLKLNTGYDVLNTNKNKTPIKISDDIESRAISAPRVSGGSANVQKVKDDYEKLQQAVQSARREIELAAIAHGTSSNEVQQAFTKYNQLNTQLNSINALFDTEKVKVEQQKGAYQLLNENVTSLTAKLRDLAAENQVGSTEWVNYKTQLKEAQTELDNVNKSLTDSGVKLEDYGKQISSSISSGLVNALRNGGNAFDAFSSLATTALQKILDKLIEMTFVTPVLNAFTGGTGGSLFSGIAKIFGSANGNVFQNGNVIPFARGGVVNKPTIFPMANGGTGLMGEAGAEAVMPLRRMSNGRLGVEAENENGKAVQVNIYNQSGANVETRKRDDGSMDIFIRKVNEALSSERTSSGFRSAYAREDRKGVQAV